MARDKIFVNLLDHKYCIFDTIIFYLKKSAFFTIVVEQWSKMENIMFVHPCNSVSLWETGFEGKQTNLKVLWVQSQGVTNT